MKDKIIKKARDLNIDCVGFCKAKKYDELLEILKKRREMFGKTPFEEENLEKRINPFLLMPDAKSVIVCLFPYNILEQEGNLAKYASVSDYHKVAKEKLKKIGEVLGEYKFLCFADNDPLCDRFLAYKSGLGFYGKNSMLINDKYGSYFAIGFILTDAEIEPDYPKTNSCLGCDLCIKSCPGGAISKDFGFDYTKCVSYITQAKDISPEQEKLLEKSKTKVGCDVCQLVCPHNKNAKNTPISEFGENVINNIRIEDILGLSNREFKEKYQNFAFFWLGKNKIIRNLSEKNK